MGLWFYVMKTTVEIPDKLLIAAKKRAAELRKPLRALIESGLRRELEAGGSTRLKSEKVSWTVVDGGLPHGKSLDSREQIITLMNEKSG